MFYYKICNLDSRIANPDQRLTTDAEKWSDSLATLYLNISKPSLDIIFFAKKLAELLGWIGPGSVIAWYMFTGFIMRTISPRFGRMTAIE